MNQDPVTARQQAIQNIDRSLLVCAAAGTGKTTTLIDRYLRILHKSDIQPTQIVAITFTEKAAAEMRARLRAKLGEPDCPLPMTKILTTLEQLQQAPISTVHSFCLRLLRDNVALTGLDPQFQIIDETEGNLLRDELLTRYLYQLLDSNAPALDYLLQKLTLRELQNYIAAIVAQQNVWLADLPAFLSRPPEALLQNILQWAKTYNEHLLADFLNTLAARQLLQKSASLQVKRPDDKLYQAVRQFEAAVATRHNTHSVAEFVVQLSSILSRATQKGSKGNWYSEEEFQNIRSLLAELSDHLKQVKKDLIIIDELAKQEADIALAQSVARLGIAFIDFYRAELHRRAQLDFDGLEQETVRLLTEHSVEMQSYLHKFRHLLVDEFQDINPIQYRIITLMKTLNPDLVTFFVGDEKQSIYRFRGAEVEIFNQLRAQAQDQMLPLTTNYRSSVQLMQFYNHFFTGYLGKEPPSQPFDSHYPMNIAADKSHAIDFIPAECWAITKSAADSKAVPAATLQALAIVQKILQLVGQPLVFEDHQLRPARFGDIVVLLRNRTHQAEFEAALRCAGIPYFVVAGIGFYNQREIIDLVNFLRVMLNPSDAPALLATLRSPLVGISDRILNRFNGPSGLFQQLYDYLFDSNRVNLTLTPEEEAPLLHFHRIYQELLPSLSLAPTAQILQQILNATNYIPFLAAQFNGHQMVANVKKLVDLALEWEQSQALSPIDFIRRIQIYRTTEVREGDANLASECGNAVRIMTIHAAKGLDFPIVCLPFPKRINTQNEGILFDRDFGLGLSNTTNKTLEQSELFRIHRKAAGARLVAEERRLLYVAMTRAKDYLFICLPPKSDRADNPWLTAQEHFQQAQAAGLCTFQTVTEAELSAANRQMSSPMPAAAPATSLTPVNLSLIAPVKAPPHCERLIATDFAAQIFSSTEPTATPPPEPGTVLSPTDLGTLIHQIFAWWDYRAIQPVETYLDELLKPYLLTPEEQLPIRQLIRQWAQKVLCLDNALAQLVASAARIEKEVELAGWYHTLMLEGKADLLVHHPDGTLSLVDFKSDHVEEQPAPALIDKYNAQLRFYAFILAQCNHCAVRDINLYFIRTGKMLTTRGSPELHQLTADQIQPYLSFNVP